MEEATEEILREALERNQFRCDGMCPECRIDGRHKTHDSGCSIGSALALPRSRAAERRKALEAAARVGELVIELASNDRSVELSHNPEDAPLVWCANGWDCEPRKAETPLEALEAVMLAMSMDDDL